MAQTLQELTAANAEEDSVKDAQTDENAAKEDESLDSPQEDEDEPESGAVDDKSEQLEEDAESSEDDADESETEDWMASDGQSDDAEKEFSASDMGKARRKYKSRIKEQDSELEALKAENERLKAVPQASKLVKPKPEDFYDSDNSDAEYTEALIKWNLENQQAEAQASAATEAQQQQIREQQKQISTEVDQHYERAEKLSEKSGISSELYQSADLRVRQMIDSIFPDAGDAITDGLIANLGSGSEKVFYNLGVNETRLMEFKTRLQADSTGFKAAMYLGELKATLNAPQKRKTQAPKPAPNPQGDKQVNSSERALKKRYTEAHKSGNPQAAFDARREAKKAGADTSNW